MTDLEFMDHAEKLMLAVERSCDRINDATDADVDAQRSGGMVTLTFPNRSQIVINLQKPLHEVWMAARSGGYHYRFDGQAWQDTKGAGEFFECLSRDSRLSGRWKSVRNAISCGTGPGCGSALRWAVALVEPQQVMRIGHRDPHLEYRCCARTRRRTIPRLH